MATAGEIAIGLCAVRERARWAFWDQTAHLVADTYVEAVQSTGVHALLLPVDGRGPEALLDRVDGLMVIGGADLDPATYGQERSEHTEATYRERDEFELALTREAVKRGLPFLGICRGMQLFNVALGGTLDQHLVGDDGVPSHRRIVGTFDGTEHEIDLTPGSLAERALGGPVHEARCHHHQAVDRLGEGLIASGRARDGVIEAIELPGPGWALGVQWHPEAGDRRELFHAFARAAETWRGAQTTATKGGPQE